MKLPSRAKNPRYTAVIPALCGGLDQSKPSWLIADNALSDCRDMWFKNGRLRTRPGFFTDRSHESYVSGRVVQSITDSDGYEVLITTRDTADQTVIAAHLYSQNGEWIKTVYEGTYPQNTHAFCVSSGGRFGLFSLLLFISTGKIFAISPKHAHAADVSGHIYVPTIRSNVTPTVAPGERTQSGVDYEYRNLLTDRFAYEFTSDGAGIYYAFLQAPLRGQVLVKRRYADNTTQQIVIDEEYTTASDVMADGLKVQVDRENGWVLFTKDDVPTAVADQNLLNNIRIEVEAPFNEQLLMYTINPFWMTMGCWYGGESGGTRLFVGGHGDYVFFSEPDNPFYFTTAGWLRVGAPQQAVTALAQQNGKLVVFKEREVYTVQAVNPRLLDDVTTVTGMYSLKQLHSEIGCKHPKTIALHNNQAVFFATDGNVYRVESSGIERISDPIKPLLPPAESTCTACTMDGDYFLFDGAQILVFTDEGWYRFVWREMQMMPWYFKTDNRTLYAIAVEAQGDNSRVQWFSLQGEQDVLPCSDYRTEPVEGMLCTKAYDFGTPETVKQVTEAMVETEGTVYPSYVTERGEYSDTSHCADPDCLVRLTPNVMRVRRLSLRLRGERLAIGNVVLRLRGGMK